MLGAEYARFVTKKTLFNAKKLHIEAFAALN